MAQYKTMEIRLAIWTFLAVAVLGKQASIKMSCGNCYTKTGCLANLCLRVTGAIQDEVCSGRSVCNFASETAMTLSLCSKDYKGNICPTGLCTQSSKVNSCVSSGIQCPAGTTFSGTCSSGTLTMTFIGGSYGNSPMTFTTTNQNCTFQEVAGVFSTCLGDSFGTKCDCCSTVTVYGFGSSPSSSSTGICVDSNSSLIKFKSSIEASTSSQGYLSFFIFSLLFFFPMISIIHIILNYINILFLEPSSEPEQLVPQENHYI